MLDKKIDFYKIWKIRRQKKYKVIYKAGPSTIAMFFAGIMLASFLIFLVATGFPVFAWGYNVLRPTASAQLSQILRNVTDSEEADKHVTTPMQDPTLPTSKKITIPSIKVDTEIREAEIPDYEEALRLGVWRVQNFASPDNIEPGHPMIMVAHRFGYLDWTNEYRRLNSFFNLPKVQIGDKILVTWDQRPYVYEVRKVMTAEMIEDYNYDLILYTCQYLVSPEKVFVYAKRIN